MLNRRNHREAAKGKTLSTNKMRGKEKRATHGDNERSRRSRRWRGRSVPGILIELYTRRSRVGVGVGVVGG